MIAVFLADCLLKGNGGLGGVGAGVVVRDLLCLPLPWSGSVRVVGDLVREAGENKAVVVG